MIARETPRAIPAVSRYFAVAVGHGEYHFRLPSFGKATHIVSLLQGIEDKADGTRLISFLDAAGYAVGYCWHHRTLDLEVGPAPPTDDESAWRAYGDAVVDELQEHGLGMADLMVLSKGLIEQVAGLLGEIAEAEASAKN